MTYKVFGGTLSLTQSINQSICLYDDQTVERAAIWVRHRLWRRL